MLASISVGVSALRNKGFGRLFRLAVLALRRGGYAELVQKALTYAAARRLNREYAQWVARHDTPDESLRHRLRRRASTFSYRPLISVVMPTFNGPERYLREAIESVMNQPYPHWELCIADDASNQPQVRPVLEEYAARDERIKLCFRQKNGHISAASNSALRLATGEFIALLDQDDRLAETAFYYVVETLNRQPELALIYSDEDKLDGRGCRYDPHFKTDWNPDLFYSHNLISHLGVYRANIVRAIGGFREGVEGAQDYDLALRFIERIGPDRIGHIPRILYHWRAIPGSTATDTGQKSYAENAAVRGLQGHFERSGDPVKVVSGPIPRTYRAAPQPLARPVLVSGILDAGGQLAGLGKRMAPLLRHPSYQPVEWLAPGGSRSLVAEDNQPDEMDIRTVPLPDGAGLATALNKAAQMALGDVLVFVNAQLEPLAAGWLDELVGQALRPGVGVVGAKLLDRNDRIQDGGILLAPGLPRAYAGLDRRSAGYMCRARLMQGFSAVSAACLAVRADVFRQLGGFDDENFSRRHFDIDFCLRARARGYRVIWTPFAELRAKQPLRSLGNEGDGRELRCLEEEWAGMFRHDPFSNPNLRLEEGRIRLAVPPRLEPLA